MQYLIDVHLLIDLSFMKLCNFQIKTDRAIVWEDNPISNNTRYNNCRTSNGMRGLLVEGVKLDYAVEIIF